MGEARGYWFNPRTGAAEEIGTFQASGAGTFDPPDVPRRGHDWMLVVDDASAGFGPPGQSE